MLRSAYVRTCFNLIPINLKFEWTGTSNLICYSVLCSDNLFKVKTMTPMTLFWCLHFWLWTYFTPFCIVSIVDFAILKSKFLKRTYSRHLLICIRKVLLQKSAYLDLTETYLNILNLNIWSHLNLVYILRSFSILEVLSQNIFSRIEHSWHIFYNITDITKVIHSTNNRENSFKLIMQFLSTKHTKKPSSK